ncbi:MAG TPA: VOC family protein, partial [Flavobacteriales bacterium]|nr:VOC family protein [Flavobacteriales bacterium]
PFNDAISFYVDCRDQEEVDRYWDRFIDDGGTESMCGWLQDRYGVRWQLIPQALIRLTNDPDPARAKRVVGAMLRMKRIVVRDLEQAYKDPS